MHIHHIQASQKLIGEKTSMTQKTSSINEKEKDGNDCDNVRIRGL